MEIIFVLLAFYLYITMLILCFYGLCMQILCFCFFFIRVCLLFASYLFFKEWERKGIELIGGEVKVILEEFRERKLW